MFLYSEPGRCENSLREAGFVSPAATRVPVFWRGPSADAFLEGVEEGGCRSGVMLRSQTKQARDAICLAAREYLAAFENDGSLEIPMPALVAAAGKP